MLSIDKIDIQLLYLLYEQDIRSPLCSWQTKTFINSIKEKNESYDISYNTMVRRLQRLLEQEYISKGYKDRNAITYYLSSNGIQFVEDEIEKENSYN